MFIHFLHFTTFPCILNCFWAIWEIPSNSGKSEFVTSSDHPKSHKWAKHYIFFPNNSFATKSLRAKLSFDVTNWNSVKKYWNPHLPMRVITFGFPSRRLIERNKMFINMQMNLKAGCENEPMAEFHSPTCWNTDYFCQVLGFVKWMDWLLTVDLHLKELFTLHIRGNINKSMT